MHRLSAGSLFEEHFRFRPDVTGIKSLCLFIRKGQQPPGTLFLVLIAHHIWNPECCRSRTLRIGEHMQLRHVQSLQKVITFLKTFRLFTSAAHHHIHADEGIRHQLLYQFYLMSKKCFVIAAVHQFEHLITTTLQRNMKMRHECTAPGTISDEFIRQQVGFYRRNTITADAFHLIQCLYQIRKRLSCCLAEVTDVHARQHNLFSSFISCFLSLFHQRFNCRIS